MNTSTITMIEHIQIITITMQILSKFFSFKSQKKKPETKDTNKTKQNKGKQNETKQNKTKRERLKIHIIYKK